MEHYANKGIRRLLPDRVRTCYRAVRARLLSVGLRARAPFALSVEEHQASAHISVVVAVHDAPEITQRCLQSLERFGGEAEIVVVDDGSKLQATAELLDTTCRSSGWRLVRHAQALGHSRASEAGVAVTCRPYICLLNSDTIITPRSWAGIVGAFEESNHIAVVGPSTSQTPTRQCVPRARYCRHYWSDEQVWVFAERYVRRHQGKPVVDLPMAGGFAFFVRRSVWDSLGGFDRRLPDYGNETELCHRIGQRGLRIVWTKGSYIHHLGSESYGRTLGLKRIYQRCVEARDYLQARDA